MIKGDRVSLRLLERRDVGYLHAWLIDPDFTGPHEATHQVTEQELEKTYTTITDERWWFIKKKHRTRVGFLRTKLRSHYHEIKLYIIPEERRKGYASEAVKLIVDHLFLSENVERVQAIFSPENKAIKRVLEKNRFVREGLLRKNRFHRGAWRDSILFSIIREEWKQPTQITSKEYYTEKRPSGPWSRALNEMRTGKPFDENEYMKEF